MSLPTPADVGAEDVDAADQGVRLRATLGSVVAFRVVSKQILLLTICQ